MQNNKKNETLDTYNTFAETIGGVPSLRKKDNVLQAKIIGWGTLICIVIGAIFWGIPGGLIGILIGLIVSVLLSGVILMVLGWIRAAKKLQNV